MKAKKRGVKGASRWWPCRWDKYFSQAIRGKIKNDTTIQDELTYQGEGGEDDKAWDIFYSTMCPDSRKYQT
jgi:hypothetical protein